MQKNKDVTRLYEMLCSWRQAATMLEAGEELPRRLQQVALLPEYDSGQIRAKVPPEGLI